MKSVTRNAIILTVVALLLSVSQVGLWAKSTSHMHSQSQEIDHEVADPPSDVPGVAAICLLLVAAVVASTPRPR